MQTNINPYNQEEFTEKFIQTDLYTQLKKDFDEIGFDWHFIPPTMMTAMPLVTPRQIFGTPAPRVPTKFSAVPFYYLEYITKHNPSTIYDIGCGWNKFKQYLPNIIGVGPDPKEKSFSYADEISYFDPNFVAQRRNSLPAMFSISALHFIPISRLRQQVLDFGECLVPGGHAFLSLNLMPMLNSDLKFVYSKVGTDINEIENYCRVQLSSLPFEIEVFDLDFSGKVNSPPVGNFNPLNNYMDGNLRMVFRKPID